MAGSSSRKIIWEDMKNFKKNSNHNTAKNKNNNITTNNKRIEKEKNTKDMKITHDSQRNYLAKNLFKNCSKNMRINTLFIYLVI